MKMFWQDCNSVDLCLQSVVG